MEECIPPSARWQYATEVVRSMLPSAGGLGNDSIAEAAARAGIPLPTHWIHGATARTDDQLLSEILTLVPDLSGELVAITDESYPIDGGHGPFLIAAEDLRQFVRSCRTPVLRADAMIILAPVIRVIVLYQYEDWEDLAVVACIRV